MKRTNLTVVAAATAATLALAGCGSSGEAPEADGPITLTVSGWALESTPEFQALADGFEALHDDVTVEVVEYDSAEYNTLLTADLAAGSGPDIITQKEVKFVTTFQAGGQLMDVSDLELPEGLSGTDSYEIDGATYAVPYRQDAWVLYYNRDLFAAAGVDEPDGSWTWDDYADAAEALDAGLAAAGSAAQPTYLHRWQSTVQGFATAQSGADIISGEIDQFEDAYDRTLALQDDGLQVEFNTSTANQLTYQGEFGNQNAAMMPMGTWYVASLISQQASGDAQDFEWGIAPAPQLDDETTGTDATPVTFGDPTGFGINANIDESEVEMARAFLEYAASEEAATMLAELGVTPALLTDDVTAAYFAVDGAPTDELSQFAWSTHEVIAENPTSPTTATVQGILNDMHSAIMSESEPVESALETAQQRIESEAVAP